MKNSLLIIDDETEICKGLEEYFCKHYDTHFETEWIHGLAAVYNIRPSVILLDINLVKTSGLNLADIILNKPETKNTQIIFITGYFSEELLIEAKKLGAVEIVQKPFNIRKLRDLITKSFKKYEELEKNVPEAR